MAKLSGDIDISKYVQQLAELKELVKKAKSGEKDLNDVNEQLQESFNSVSNQVKALKDVYASLNKEIDNFNEKQGIANSLKALEAELESVSKSLKNLREDVTSTNQRLNELSSGTGGKNSSGGSSAWGDLETQLKNINLTSEDLQKNFLDVKTTMDSSGASVITYNNNLDTTVKVYERVNEEGKQYKVTLEKINQENKNAVSSAQYIDSSTKALKRLGLEASEVDDIVRTMNGKSVSSWMVAKQSISANGDAVYELRNNLDKVVTVTQKNVNGTNQFSASLKNVANSAKEATKEAGTWGYSWKRAWQSFLTYMSVTDIFFRVKNAIVDMVHEVEELDSALVELRKVTDLEGDSLERFIDNAYKAGEAVAKTGTEMIEAATAFAKAGYDSDMALKLGEIAAMYTNIADEEISTAKAADFIIAQLKAFNLEADTATETLENAYHVIDAVNEVSNNFAVSSADIASNLGKASAVMANAGNSLEQMIGLMTAGTEITRNASKAANGLKTLTLRLQGMNDEGERDLEVQAQMEELFNKLGISVYNANGELKNTYEILDSLAPVYQNLTNAEKAYVTEAIAGKYQAQNAAAILSNWQTAIDATTTAMNSNGSAAKENEKVLASIQGHLKKLKSEWENLSRSIIDSDLIKLIIDLGAGLLWLANTGVVKTLIKVGVLIALFITLRKVVVSANEGLKHLIIKLSGAEIQAYKTATANKVLAGSYKLVKTSSVGTASSLNITTKSMEATTIASGSLGTSLKLLGSSIVKFLTSPLGIATLAFVALYEVIEWHNDKIQKHIDRMAEMNEAYAESSKSINENIEDFKKYRKILEDANSTEEEVSDAKKELLEIQNQLAEKYDLEADKLDLVNGKYGSQLSLLKEIEQLKSKKYIEENYDDIETAKKFLNNKVHYGVSLPKSIDEKSYSLSQKGKNGFENFLEQTMADGSLKTREGWISFYDTQIKKIKEMGASWGLTKKEIEETVAAITASRNKITSNEQFKKSQETYKNYIEAEIQSGDKWSETYYKIKEQQAKYAEAIKNNDSKTAADALEELEKLQNELSGQTFSTKDKDYKDQLEQWNYMVKMFDGYREKIKQHNFIKDYFETDNLGRDSEYKKTIERMILGLKNDLNKEKITTDDFFDVDGNALEDISEVAEKYGFTVNELADALINLGAVTEGINHIVSRFAGLTKSWSESVDSLQTKYQDLMGIMDEYHETGYITIDSLQTLLEKDWEYLQYLEFENGQLKLNTNALKAEAEAKLDEAEATAYADAIQSIKLLKTQNETEVNKHLKTSYDNLGQSISGLNGKYNELINNEATLDAIRDANGEEGVESYANVQKELETKLQLINKVRQNLNKDFNATMGYSGSKSSSSSKSSKSEKEWWEKEFDALKDQFDYSEITIEQYINGLEGLLGKLDKGSDAWRKINKELQKQRLDKVKDDYNAGRISLNQYIISLQNLQQAYKAGTAEWNKLADAIKKAKLDQLKEQQNDLKAALSAVNNVLQVQVNKYKELKDAADKKYDDEIEKLNDSRDSLNNNNDDYERAQKAVIKFLNEQLDSINSQKDSIENYYDNVIDSIEKMNEDTQESIELAEAYEALINAMTQKTKKVWKEGLGWTWTADQKAIEDAKKTYDDLVKNATTKEIEKQKDKTIKSLEEQISSLQEYIDSWDEVFDKFDNEKNTNLANLLLGDNWTEMVSQLDPQVVEDFSNAYYDLQKNLEETEKQIEILNKQKEEEDKYWNDLIDDLENYKDKWSDIANAYTETQDALKAEQIIGANWEKEILDKRLDVLENFKNKYNAILAEINKVDNMSTTQAAGYTALKLPGYANGGEVNYTGLAVLHGTPNKPEYVLNNTQMRNLLGNLTKPRFTSVKNNGNPSNVYNYNFGNIELPNVNNAKQFINELKSLVNTSKNL